MHSFNGFFPAIRACCDVIYTHTHKKVAIESFKLGTWQYLCACVRVCSCSLMQCAIKFICTLRFTQKIEIEFAPSENWLPEFTKRNAPAVEWILFLFPIWMLRMIYICRHGQVMDIHGTHAMPLPHYHTWDFIFRSAFVAFRLVFMSTLQISFSFARLLNNELVETKEQCARFTFFLSVTYADTSSVGTDGVVVNFVRYLIIRECTTNRYFQGCACVCGLYPGIDFPNESSRRLSSECANHWGCWLRHMF